MKDNFKYFNIVKELNEEYNKELLNKKLHFRGNQNSFSLISLAKETAEKGKSGMKSKDKAVELLKNDDELSKILKPGRATPEKELQAWMIYSSMNNNGFLPFDVNMMFITSELVFENKERYKLLKSKREKRDIRNDILAIDKDNNLCIIELKSKRDNEVKNQTIEFEKVVKNETAFFHRLVKLYTDKDWNGEIRKISIWPKAKGKSKKREFKEVEEFNYIMTDENSGYYIE